MQQHSFLLIIVQSLLFFELNWVSIINSSLSVGDLGFDNVDFLDYCLFEGVLL